MKCRNIVNSKIGNYKIFSHRLSLTKIFFLKNFLSVYICVYLWLKIFFFFSVFYIVLLLSGCAGLRKEENIPVDIHEKGVVTQEVTPKRAKNSENERWKKAAALFNNGFQLIKDDPISAIALYNEGITLAPDRWEAYYNLGIIYMKLQNMEKAKNELLKSLKYKAPPAMVYNALGIMHISMEKNREAIDYFKKALSFEKLPVVMINIANLYQSMGQVEESIKYYHQLESTDTLNLPLHHYNIGVLMYKMGDFKNAHEAFKTAEVTEGENIQLLFYQAQTLLKLGEYEAALKIYQRIVDKDSSDPTPYKNMGIIYEIYFRDMAKAFESYTAYIEKGGEKTKDIESWIEMVKVRMAKKEGQ
ncbi:MAG: hypothetical protein A3I04_04990 [Nitrospinae bacterium RIFCSPLOWO2_02_FULL_39_110]|nr:MAG: hypothetical protein A2W53_05720 [Nitrospinae bacterium RIFCSPHIGHO2_02_39_11]OGV98497.1 MAG: hypothetical protein A3D97_04050 [Nitrospinae bacterium RIFCSPHIGHO2_12_FULL_39_42]OGW00483.1 MAG: hypothetical protein A3D20_05020 [Nitrospinae bacterium RIFCSPHIGHO2_02_FULL_39_82]OGW04880.1 MAG: hypothetical protein A3I04_04990 [Nitrospinae bacterium RIFCSPLOWO2_02_FULL_39_110]OGW07611.1 MAG: hypothetical protein A2Z59_07665 [Nitrospinae bacterium RIFCSPLOWO2_02_39_17]OGW09295.1 MAG: hypoth